MTLETQRLGGHLAARATGVHLGDDLDEGTVKEILDALHEHLVLIFPEQHLSDAQLLTLMGRLGSPYVHPIGRHHGVTEPVVEHIIDDADHPPYQDGWHTDVSFDHSPPRIGLLQAIDLPDHGGDTCWSSMYAAYDRLSQTMQQVLDGLTGIHAPGIVKAFASKVGQATAEAIADEFRGTEHPVVGTHPATGREYLYVNEGFTKRIKGMTDAESAAILRFCFLHVRTPNIGYRHRWTVGELALWDERATQHLGVSDHYPQRREMARVTVGDLT